MNCFNVLKYILTWIISYFIYKLVMDLDELDSSLYASITILFVLIYFVYIKDIKNNNEHMINISSQTDNRNIREEPRLNINASVKCNPKQNVINEDVLTRSDVDYDFNNYTEPIENTYFIKKGKNTFSNNESMEIKKEINFDNNFGGRNNDNLYDMMRIDLGETINKVDYEDLRYN